jgi:putative oxidoreductase
MPIPRSQNSTLTDLGLLGARVVLGSYLAAHGAQKLFGSFDGPGLDATSQGFHHLGLRPGRVNATMAGVSELGGGLLTVAGLGGPVGPTAIAGTMVVASAVHRSAGPFSTGGGYELPLTNLGAALALAVAGPGRYSLDGLTGLRVPRFLVRLTVAVGAVAAGVSLAKLLRAQPPATEATSEDAENAGQDPSA